VVIRSVLQRRRLHCHDRCCVVVVVVVDDDDDVSSK
jgi:hypothetical protein